MIDLSKYEGHTSAPWGITDWAVQNKAVSIYSILGDWKCFATVLLGIAKSTEKDEEGKANCQLIQDAPFLLAEVERLQEIVEKMRNCGNCQHIYESICGNNCRIQLNEAGRPMEICASHVCDRWESGK